MIIVSEVKSVKETFKAKKTNFLKISKLFTYFKMWKLFITMNASKPILLSVSLLLCSQRLL